MATDAERQRRSRARRGVKRLPEVSAASARAEGSDAECFAHGYAIGCRDAEGGLWPILRLNPSLFVSPWNRGYVAGYLGKVHRS